MVRIHFLAFSAKSDSLSGVGPCPFEKSGFSDFPKRLEFPPFSACPRRGAPRVGPGEFENKSFKPERCCSGMSSPPGGAIANFSRALFSIKTDFWGDRIGAGKVGGRESRNGGSGIRARYTNPKEKIFGHHRVAWLSWANHPYGERSTSAR